MTAAPEMTERRRQIKFLGLHNFRDLGGYQTVSGQVTRWRSVYRSDDLSSATPSELERLNREFGIRTVIDLRTSGEANLEGAEYARMLDANRLHIPLFQDLNARYFVESRGGETLADLMCRLIDASGKQIAEVLRVLSLDHSLPAVVHCVAGKDRTGLVAGVLLAALDVPPTVIAADYAMSAMTMGPIIQKMKQNGRYESLVASMPAGALGAEDLTMRRILSHLSANYGGARQYLLANGLTGDELERLQRAVLY